MEEMKFEGFEKDTNVVYKDLVESYTEVDNEDNWFEISETQNSTQTAIIAFKACERIGIWMWDDTFPYSLEDFIKDSVLPRYNS